MCDTGNLIDFDDAAETITTEAPIDQDNDNFKGPFDPFDSVEKEAEEACLKTKKTVDLNLSDLGEESPPVCLNVSSDNEVALTKKLSKLINDPPAGNTTPLNLYKGKRHFANLQFDHLLCGNGSPQMLAAESPLKLVDDDNDTMTDSKVNSHDKFEADLKMLRIPILETLSTIEEASPRIPKSQSLDETETEQKRQFFHTIQTQAEAKNVEELLEDLREMIKANVEPKKMELFNPLIESIKAKITAEKGAAAAEKEKPYTFTREGTFDLELEKQKGGGERQEKESPPQEMPDVMLASSATFDGNANSFEEAAPAPAPPPPEPFMTTQVTDVKLVQQISELLERQNLTKTEDALGKTVILVVNSQQNQMPTCPVQPSPLRVGKIASKISDEASAFRRRSSSLSIHDKTRFSSGGGRSILKPNDENLMPLPPQKEPADTPLSSFRQRRNSYSTTTASANKAVAVSRALNLNSQQPKLYEPVKLITRTKNSGLGESIVKCSGPMKAIIPIKRVVPMMKANDDNEHDFTLPKKPSTSSSSSSTSSSSNFHTSTPMSQMRSQQRSSLAGGGGSLTPNVRRTSLSKKLDTPSVLGRSNRVSMGGQSGSNLSTVLKSKSPMKSTLPRKSPAKFKM